MAAIWTEKQKEAIEKRGSDLLVAAAAGSGKTAVLVERIKQLIISGEAEIDELLVVTFTNAAASEMKGKIVDAIRRQIGETPENAEFLRSQLAKASKANISTFHAFAMEVIRRYFHVIDIDPGFKVCDEAQSRLLMAEAIDTLFEERLAEGSADFLRFLDAYSSEKSFDSIKKQLLNCYGSIRSVPSPLERLREAAEGLASDAAGFEASAAFDFMVWDIRQMLEAAQKSCAAAESLLLDAGLDRLAAKLAADKNALQSLGKSALAGDMDALAAGCGAFALTRLAANGAEKAQYADIKDALKLLRDKYKEQINDIKRLYLYQDREAFLAEMQQTYPMALMLHSLLCDFHSIYGELKRDKGLADFSDIEHYALEILENEDAAGQYREKFKYVFIDEYQDSNVIQETLIRRIARSGSVFMVGDVKQSIYKFRLAEPEIFESKYAAYRSGSIPNGAVIDLNRNFRSKKGVIDAVNSQFERIMRGYDENARLYQGVEYDGSFDRRCELHIAESRFDDGVDEEIAQLRTAELEAYAAAGIIKKAVGRERIYRTKTNEERPLEYGDIVILMRSVKGAAESYKKVFDDEGIPLHVEENDGYFNTIEVEVFLNVLRCIDNKRQDVPLISALYSPTFGFSAGELAQIRLSLRGRGVSFCDAFLERAQGEDALADKCRGVLEKLAEWQRRSRLTPLADFVWQLLMETGFYLYAGALAGGEQRQANLRALVDKAAEFSEKNSGIYGFLAYVEQLKERKIPMGQISLTGEGENAVRIMTIHKSKGLEFPFVITAGLGRRFASKSESAPMSFHKDLGLAMELVSTQEHWRKKTLLHRIIERKNLRDRMEEEVRILYVAYTRAADRLVLLGTVPDFDEAMEKAALTDPADIIGARSFLDMILPLAMQPQTPIDIVCEGIPEISVRQQAAGAAKLAELLKSAEDLTPQKELADRLSYRYPFEEELSLKSKYSVTELGRGESRSKLTLDVPGALEDSVSGSGSMGQITAAAKGTVYHLVMEHIDFADLDAADPKEVLRRLTDEEFISQREADAVDVSVIAEFLKSPIASRMSAAAKAGRLYRETPFTLRRDHRGSKVLVQGIIDCYFEEQNEKGETEYVLLDYKSNYLPDTDESTVQKITEEYREQLELYCEALQNIKKIRVKEKYFCFLTAGITIKL